MSKKKPTEELSIEEAKALMGLHRKRSIPKMILQELVSIIMFLFVVLGVASGFKLFITYLFGI